MEQVHKVGSREHLHHLLNWLGSEGWELVSLAQRVKAQYTVNNLGGDMVAVFKRTGLGVFDRKLARDGADLPDNYEEAPLLSRPPGALLAKAR